MPETTSTEPARAPRLRLVRVLLAAGLVLLIGAGAVLYGMRNAGKEGVAACPGAAETVAKLDPLVHGEIAALALSKSPKPLDISFEGENDAPKTLADFQGRTVLLNLWATWCVPCRKEMPALDTLQAASGGPAFQVVAVNTDTAKLERAKTFFADVGIRALPFYADPTGRILGALHQSTGLMGLPTTFLVNKSGCVLGTMAGPADWSSPEARRLIEAASS